MEKTRVRNSISRSIPKSRNDSMHPERSQLIKAITESRLFASHDRFCNTIVWQGGGNQKITATLNSFDFVMEIEDDLTVSDITIDFGGKWIVAHIDCATNEVRDLLNRICDIYTVDRIF